MIGFVIRRLLVLPVTILGLTMLIFGMLQTLSPAERAALYLTSPPRNPEALAAVIEKYGLDQPIPVQYVNWLGQVLQGNLGWSTTTQQSVVSAIGSFFPATLELAVWSFIPIMVVGIWLGVKAAVNHNRPLDQAARLFSIAGYAFPIFVFGLLMLMIFYAALHWFPPGRLSDWATNTVYSRQFTRFTGMHTVDSLLNGRPDIFVDALRHLLLPSLSLGYANCALILRVMRSSTLEVLRLDYTTVARAKGLPEHRVINRHVRPNALIPVITIGGLLFAGLLSGAVVVETVFDFHGFGWWSATAALNLDAVAVLGATLFNGVLLVLSNLVVDVMYTLVDPRIRHR